jgi:hypothetical protein
LTNTAGDSVFYYDKENPERGIQSRNRKKILRIKDFYSEHTSAEKMEALTERAFAAEIDDKIPSFANSVVAATMSGVNFEEYFRLRDFSETLLLNFFYRSPYIRKRAIKQPSYRISYIFSWLSLMVEHRRRPNKDEQSRAQNNRIQEILRNVHKNQNLLKNLTCCLVAPHEQDFFITGSNPVYVQFPGMLHFLKGENRTQRFYFMPLTPDSCLFFTDQPIENVIFNLQKGEAEGLNYLIAQQSKKLISHDKTLLSQHI